MFRSLGLASDALVMQGQSVFEEYPDRVVMRTPAEPNYWSGNAVIMKQAPVDPRADVKLFHHDFPDATHVTVVWDVPGLNPGPIRAALPEHDIETFDVLSLRGVPAAAALPERIVLRSLESDADWEAATSLQAEIAIEDGYDPADHIPFLKRRNAALRRQVAKGSGQWFGAFDGRELVAQMGIFYDDRMARYQSVETRASHRRRGICAALLRHCGQWALERAPRADLVIMTETESAAGRLYRRMGFELAETFVEAKKRGY